MDARNEITGCYQHEDADEQCAYVEQHDVEHVDLHGSLADIVGLRIEFDDARIVLQQHDAQSQDVAPEESPAYDIGGKP